MTESNAGIMRRLKSETSELHTMAEGRTLQRELARGALPRELYVAFLGQMHLVHAALEAAISRAAPGHRAFESVVRQHHHRQVHLRVDLEFFGVNAGTVEPVSATADVVTEIERIAIAQPVALLGMLYVLEGSTNGSRFIATAMHRKQGLAPGPGLLYLDPHGDLQKVRWLAFKRDMDDFGFNQADSDVIVDAAVLMFQRIADISDELATPAAILSAP